jgi:Flp pilus assembly protein TadG
MTASRERGSAAVELVLVTPLLVLFLVSVVFGGRLMIATSDLNDAARSSARAASLARDPGAAAANAERTARDELNRAGVPCRDIAVDADTRQFAPGGTVAVTIRCAMPLSDLGLLGLGASRTVTAHQLAVVDRYRAVTP